MNKLEEGDICLYTDVCVTIIEDLEPLFNLCIQNGGIYLFDNRNVHPQQSTWHNSPWVKGDCFSMMGSMAAGAVLTSGLGAAAESAAR